MMAIQLPRSSHPRTTTLVASFLLLQEWLSRGVSSFSAGVVPKYHPQHLRQQHQQQQQQHNHQTRTLVSWSLHETHDSTVTETNAVSRRAVLATTALTTLLAVSPRPARARLDPVNRPDLLPSESGQNVIQVEKFLTAGQAKRMNDQLAKLEKETGFRVRVLCQAYPQTPGLAIRDYWDLGKEGQKDDKYVVLVVDQFGGKGNVLNFNVGEGLKFNLPNVFWTRLQGKYGTTFFVKENGIDVAIINAIDAITNCLRSEDQYCVTVPDDGLNLKSIGF